MMSAFQPGEAFMLTIKLSLYAGVVISFPLLLYFLLQFIIPGLLEHERKLLYKCMAVGFGLFLAGTLFCYFIVLPRVLTFFTPIPWNSASPMNGASATTCPSPRR